jgi:hypothetical protein
MEEQVSKGTGKNNQDPREVQIKAISSVFDALKGLDSDLAIRVLEIVAGLIEPKYHLQPKNNSSKDSAVSNESNSSTASEDSRMESGKGDSIDTDNVSDGINIIGKKWLARNDLSIQKVSEIFSLGVDEIDLVSKSVPGNTVAKRMRSVFLLKGIASLLSGGAPRFTHDQIREVSQHYKAWDNTNSSKYIKNLSSEVSGSAAAGYTLTTRGLSEAASIIKEMIAGK